MVHRRMRRLVLVAAGAVVGLLISASACAPVLGRILLDIGKQVAVTEGTKYVEKWLAGDNAPQVPTVTINFTDGGDKPTNVTYTVQRIKTIAVQGLQGNVSISGSTCAWTITVTPGTTAKVEITGEEGDSIHCDGALPPPSATQGPSDGGTPTKITKLTLYGNQQNGKRFLAPSTGTYRFTYVDGAYAQGPLCCFPPGKYPWLTGFVIFNGSSPQFTGVPDDGSNRPFVDRRKALAWAVDNGYMPTVEKAKAAALRAPSVEVDLAANQTVTLVCIEARDYYYDNVGSITIDISKVS